MADSNVKIHDSVREHYAGIANSSGSCCSENTSCECNSTVYDDALIEDLHSDVVNLSLGCGDPVSIAGLKKGEIVLDLGSGGGIDCFLAAMQVGAEGYVIGVDMTPEMLAKANTNKEKTGIKNVEFRQGNIEDLPVDDNSIDIIMSNCVINLSPQKQQVFSEAIRVLKPGGRVSISDIVTEGEFDHSMREDMAQWSQCVTGAIDVSRYTGLMREAGFVNIQVVDKSNADDKQGKDMPRVYSARITAYKPE